MNVPKGGVSQGLGHAPLDQIGRVFILAARRSSTITRLPIGRVPALLGMNSLEQALPAPMAAVGRLQSTRSSNQARPPSNLELFRGIEILIWAQNPVGILNYYPEKNSGRRFLQGVPERS
jgi:hypothetical protein